MSTSPSSPPPCPSRRSGRPSPAGVIAPDDDGYDEARAVVSGDSTAGRRSSSGSPTRTTSPRRRRSRARPGWSSPSAAAATAAPGTASTDGGIVLDLRDMTALDIDVDGRTAWAETGLTAGEYTAAVGEHGLATGFGDTGSVGIGGITLGGGVGYLVRKHGLTIDDLLAAEIVTADGELLRVDADAPPGPVLGDPRRRRQLRRRDPVPVPAARAAAFVGGMLILPGDAGTVAGLHRRRGGRAGGAVDHRQRHALPADAVRARGAPRPARHPGADGVCRRDAEAGERGDGAVPGARDADRRHGPADALPRDVPAGRRRLPPDRGPATHVHRSRRPRGGRRRSWSDLEASTAIDAGRPAARPGWRDGPRARPTRRRSRTAIGGSWSTSRRLYEGPDDQAAHEAWVDGVRRRAPSRATRRATSTSSATRARPESGRPIRARPGTGSTAIKRRYDPDNLFRLNQNITPAGIQAGRGRTMTYPEPGYLGESGQANATYRPADHAPDLTYRTATVHYLATGASTGGGFGLYRWEMGRNRADRTAFPPDHLGVVLHPGRDRRPLRRDGRTDTRRRFVYVPPGGFHGFRNQSGEPASMLLQFAPGAPREGYFEGLAAFATSGQPGAEELAEFYLRHDNHWR